MTEEERVLRRERLLAGIAQSGEAADGTTFVVWPKKGIRSSFLISRWDREAHDWREVGHEDDAETALLRCERAIRALDPS